MENFKTYRRTSLAEMRPYIRGEDLTSVTTSNIDKLANDVGMIERNPKDHKDQRYVRKEYFEDNFEEIKGENLMGIVSEKFLVEDIKIRIKDGFESVDYIRGFMVACYLLEGITKNTLEDLKVYLKEKYIGGKI